VPHRRDDPRPRPQFTSNRDGTASSVLGVHCSSTPGTQNRRIAHGGRDALVSGGRCRTAATIPDHDPSFARTHQRRLPSCSARSARLGRTAQSRPRRRKSFEVGAISACHTFCAPARRSSATTAVHVRWPRSRRRSMRQTLLFYVHAEAPGVEWARWPWRTCSVVATDARPRLFRFDPDGRARRRVQSTGRPLFAACSRLQPCAVPGTRCGAVRFGRVKSNSARRPSTAASAWTLQGSGDHHSTAHRPRSL
jgi:hypothetical protein